MNWVIFGVVLIAIGAILFFVRQGEKSRAFAIRSARSATMAELATMSKEIANEIGGGSWREYVKVTGMIECDRPLTSELRQEPCVHYTMSVRREYEETVTVKDDKGETRTETRRGSETLSNNQQSVPFWLKDDTGWIEVNPDRAEIDTVQILDEFRPDSGYGGRISYGRFALNVGTFPSARRTLGYHYSESVLPIQRRLFALGTLSDSGGRLTLQRPTESGQQFILSLKSEEELVRDADVTAQYSFYGMIACLAIGVLLILIGLVAGVA
ncbi:MAG: E3 ubiquitin ligase family protein [Elainellaceae cyanobacterium]